MMTRYCIFCFVAFALKVTSAFPTSASSDIVITSEAPSLVTSEAPSLVTSEASTVMTSPVTLDGDALHYLSGCLKWLGEETKQATEQLVNETLKHTSIGLHEVLALLQPHSKPTVQDQIINDAEQCRNIKVVVDTVQHVLSQYKDLMQEIPVYALDTTNLIIRLNCTQSWTSKLLADGSQDTYVTPPTKPQRDNFFALQTLGYMGIQIDRISTIVRYLDKC